MRRREDASHIPDLHGGGKGLPLRSRRTLASIIEHRRRERGMSQAQLAGRVGVSRQWVISLEAAEGNPSLTNLIAVLDALGLEIQIGDATNSERPLNDPPGLPDLDAGVNQHAPRQGTASREGLDAVVAVAAREQYSAHSRGLSTSPDVPTTSPDAPPTSLG